MPLHDYIADRKRRQAAIDPLKVQFAEDGPLFVFQPGVSALAFIDLYAACITQHKNKSAVDDRVLLDLIVGLVTPEQQEDFRAAIVSVVDPIDSETWAQLVQDIFEFYVRGNPTEPSDGGSDSPSTDGENSKEDSPTPGPKYD